MTLEEILRDLEESYPSVMLSTVTGEYPLLFTPKTFAAQVGALLDRKARVTFWSSLERRQDNVTVGHLEIAGMSEVVALVYKEQPQKHSLLLLMDRNEQVLDVLHLGADAAKQMEKYRKTICANPCSLIVKMTLVIVEEEKEIGNSNEYTIS